MVKTVSDFSVTFSLAKRWKRFQRPRIIPRKLNSHLLHSVIIYHISIFFEFFLFLTGTPFFCVVLKTQTFVHSSKLIFPIATRFYKHS